MELRPDFPEAYNNLGSAQREKGQLDEAVAAYRNAVRLKPDYAEAYRNLGNLLREMGKLEGETDGAIAALRQAVRLKPELPDIHNNLGAASRTPVIWMRRLRFFGMGSV